jgi:hypothetical protein
VALPTPERGTERLVVLRMMIVVVETLEPLDEVALKRDSEAR